MLLGWSPDSPVSTDFNRAFTETGWTNITWSLSVPGFYRAEYPKHAATLSIKSTFSGQEIYEIDGRPPVLVDPRSYLILN